MKRAKRFFAILFSGIFLFAVGCVNQDRRSDASGTDAVPTFTLKDLNGADQNLETLLGEHKAVLINFWATWCPPCREEIPDLIRLQEKYKDASFTILGVNVGESQAKVSAFVKKIGINYPVVLDQDNVVSEQYGVVGIPTSLLVNSKSRIIGEYHSAGPELFADVEKALK